MNYRMDSGHVNKGFSDEEIGGSIHFDTQNYDEIDLGVKEVMFEATPFSKYHILKVYRGCRHNTLHC